MVNCKEGLKGWVCISHWGRNQRYLGAVGVGRGAKTMEEYLLLKECGIVEA